MTRLLVCVMNCAVNGPGIFEGPRRGVEEEKAQEKHFSGVWIQHVHPADLFPSLSTIHRHCFGSRYCVSPHLGGACQSSPGHHELFVVLTVLHGVKQWVQGPLEIAFQF